MHRSNVPREVRCTHVFPSGHMVHDFRFEGVQVASWQRYNATHRPHCALFVDGDFLAAPATCTVEQIEAMQARIAEVMRA